MSTATFTDTTSSTSDVVKIPLMKWSQTTEHVVIVADVAKHPNYSPTVVFDLESLTIEVAVDAHTQYHVHTELYGAILPEKSSWKVASNGQLIISLAKRFVDDDEEDEDTPESTSDTTPDSNPTTEKVTLESTTNASTDNVTPDSTTEPVTSKSTCSESTCTECADKPTVPNYRYCGWWEHPFLDRAYKGFVRIDWTRWEDEPEQYDVGDEEENYPDNLGPLNDASPMDFGGSENEFPTEQGNMFQDMLKNMNMGDLGENTDEPQSGAMPDMPGMPDLAELTKNMDMSKMEEMMKSLSSGDMTGLEGLKDMNLDKMSEMLDTMGLNKSDSDGDSEEDSSEEEITNDTTEQHSPLK